MIKQRRNCTQNKKEKDLQTVARGGALQNKVCPGKT